MSEPQLICEKNGKWTWHFPTWRGYPYGTFIGEFSTKEEAIIFKQEHPEQMFGGIPLCSALKDWRRAHGLEV